MKTIENVKNMILELADNYFLSETKQTDLSTQIYTELGFASKPDHQNQGS